MLIWGFEKVEPRRRNPIRDMTKGSDYKNFSADDFCADAFFQDWVLRPDAEQNRFWQQFMAENPGKKEAVEKAAGQLKAIRFKEAWPAEANVEQALRQALNTINRPAAAVIHMNHPPVRHLYKKWWAAAAIFLVVGVASWVFFAGKGKAVPTEMVKATPAPQETQPGMSGAILTLADGRKFVLDSAQGALAEQGSAKVVNQNGRLLYNLQGNSAEVVYNNMATPNGRQYQLLLSDGTRVWLNAASSITFPTAFVGMKRSVSITGEAYFEVAHDAARPFEVKVNDMTVRVLGTHFNVNSYANEAAINTTLLEGRIAVSAAGHTRTVKPGQQAQVAQTGTIKLVKDVDVNAVVAWKNGYFSFQNADMKTIMRQVARWYDVEVQFEGTVPDVQFSGEIGRNLTLTQFLGILEETRIHYKVTGKKLMIAP